MATFNGVYVNSKLSFNKLSFSCFSSGTIIYLFAKDALLLKKMGVYGWISVNSSIYIVYIAI